ncbi:MAG: hypothetical protein ACLTDR_00805 [Adlercreutzia equolifaciens]
MEEGRTVSNSYKDTMNLPETDFPMRGNLPAREPERLAQWQEMDIYRHVLEKNADGKPFVLHDGPPCMPTAPFTSVTPSTRSSRTSSLKATPSAGTSPPTSPVGTATDSPSSIWWK